MSTETLDIGPLALQIESSRAGTLVWVDSGPARILIGTGDTRQEAVREAVERLEALTAAIQETPAPAEVARG